MKPSRVTISDLQHRPDHKSPWIVRWRVDGQGKVRAYRTKLAADKYRARLLAAEGEQFDTATGEPLSWAQTEAGTWATFAQGYVRRRWSQWSPGQRRSAVEALTIATSVLVRPRARQRPAQDELYTYLRESVLLPEDRAGDVSEDIDRWLVRWSLPLEELTVERVEAVLDAYATRQDGEPCAATTTARRRAVLYGALKAAVNRRLIDENPLDRSDWKTPVAEHAVDPKRVPSPAQMRAMLEKLRGLSDRSGRMVAFGALVGFAGLRPSEATALKVSELTLPESGWGEARLSTSITRNGSRYSDGDGTDERGLKKRKARAVRRVPLAPEVVKHLAQHLIDYPSEDGYVFANARGTRLTSEHFGDALAKVVRQLHPTGPLAQTTPYAWRHAAASMMLKAGVSAPDVAERLGHDVNVLLSTYANVLDQEREVANARIERALGE